MSLARKTLSFVVNLLVTMTFFGSAYAIYYYQYQQKLTPKLEYLGSNLFKFQTETLYCNFKISDNFEGSLKPIIGNCISRLK